MSKGTLTEFGVMKGFAAVLPSMDDSSLRALLAWIEARGKEELERRARAATPTAPTA